jgi:hypothetical protein
MSLWANPHEGKIERDSSTVNIQLKVLSSEMDQAKIRLIL